MALSETVEVLDLSSGESLEVPLYPMSFAAVPSDDGALLVMLDEEIRLVSSKGTAESLPLGGFIPASLTNYGDDSHVLVAGDRLELVRVDRRKG